MTEKQFWMKMDQISESKKMTSSDKSMAMMKLLADCYDKGLNIMIGCLEYQDGTVHQEYMNSPDVLPPYKDKRMLICYTSPQYAKYDPNGCASASLFDVMNNMFNKQSIGGLVFNRFCDNPDLKTVIVLKLGLEMLLPGPKPLPPQYSEE